MFEPTTRCKEPTSSSTRLPFLSSLFVCSVLACSAKGPSAGNTADMYTADTAGLSAPTDETSLAPMGAPTLTDSAASMASGTVTSLPVDTAAGHSDVGPSVNPAPNNSQSGETNTGNSATSTIPSGVLSDASSQTVGASTTSATDNGSSGGASTVHSPPCVDPAAGIPSLHEYFANSFAIGAAIDTQYQLYAPVLTKHFNSVTAEDQMKFDALQPTEGDFTYTTADQMVDFAVTNGMQVRGHALVWHRQTPAWVFNGTSDQVLARMQNHITQVMQHFRGKVKVWDVVNEAIMDDGAYRTNIEDEGQQSGWYGALGESYIAEAFKAARLADPDAKLFYNDYYNYHPVRREAIFNLLKGLLDAGVPIDGVGLQAHLNLKPGTDPNEQSYHQTVENMEKAIEMYASLGLDVQITEMDLSLYLRGVTYTTDTFYTPENVTTEVLNQQAMRYREFFEMYRKHADVISSVSFWGVADDNTWLSEFSSGRQDFPLLFDLQHEPKPSFWSILDVCP